MILYVENTLCYLLQDRTGTEAAADHCKVRLALRGHPADAAPGRRQLCCVVLFCLAGTGIDFCFY